MDRMLATSVHRGSLIAAHVLHSALTVVVQTVIILGIGLVLGARFPGGIAGMLMILFISALLGAGFSALSNGIALMTRREETLVAVTNFFGLPLTFLSSAFMATALMPGWIRSIAWVNPVNWAVEGSRNAMLGQNWSMLGSRPGCSWSSCSSAASLPPVHSGFTSVRASLETMPGLGWARQAGFRCFGPGGPQIIARLLFIGRVSWPRIPDPA